MRNTDSWHSWSWFKICQISCEYPQSNASQLIWAKWANIISKSKYSSLCAFIYAKIYSCLHKYTFRHRKWIRSNPNHLCNTHITATNSLLPSLWLAVFHLNSENPLIKTKEKVELPASHSVLIKSPANVFHLFLPVFQVALQNFLWSWGFSNFPSLVSLPASSLFITVLSWL